eukprot:3631916-Rhodomonas_salina.1
MSRCRVQIVERLEALYAEIEADLSEKARADAQPLFGSLFFLSLLSLSDSGLCSRALSLSDWLCISCISLSLSYTHTQTLGLSHSHALTRLLTPDRWQVTPESVEDALLLRNVHLRSPHPELRHPRTQARYGKFATDAGYGARDMRVWCYGCATGSPVLRWGMEGSSALLFRFCKDVIEPDGTLTQQGSVPLSLSPRCR